MLDFWDRVRIKHQRDHAMANVAVLTGTIGVGSNALNLLAKSRMNVLRSNVTLIIPNRSNAPIIETLENRRIPHPVLDEREEGYQDNLLSTLGRAKIDIVCLAGYNALIPEKVCQEYEGRLLNIHPALLPKYGGKGMYGDNVFNAILGNREKRTGATVHHVTPQYDEGQIILQQGFEIEPEATLESIKERTKLIEYIIYPVAIDVVAESLGLIEPLKEA